MHQSEECWSVICSQHSCASKNPLVRIKTYQQKCSFTGWFFFPQKACKKLYQQKWSFVSLRCHWSMNTVPKCSLSTPSCLAQHLALIWLSALQRLIRISPKLILWPWLCALFLTHSPALACIIPLKLIQIFEFHLTTIYSVYSDFYCYILHTLLGTSCPPLENYFPIS